ncbi:MAG: adenylate kinase [Verrucomicrobiota bacterium]|jgi:adenylate kinase|nr:adenylate kinase [Verrucomicrobiota bacterium]
MKIVILLGAPGSGKGTVAARLVAADGALCHVSSGHLLRDAVKRRTPAGIEADEFMKRGELVPDAVIARMIGDLLLGMEGSRTLLLDGFPRTVPQARLLDEMIAQCGAGLSCVVMLDVPDEVLVERITGRRVCPKCGAGYHVANVPPRQAGVCDGCGTGLVVRKDDNLATVQNRLAVYRELTVPLIEFYEARGVLRRTAGTGAIDGIVERVKSAL